MRFPRNALICPRRTFVSTRFFCDEAVGFVGRRLRGIEAAVEPTGRRSCCCASVVGMWPRPGWRDRRCRRAASRPGRCRSRRSAWCSRCWLGPLWHADVAVVGMGEDLEHVGAVVRAVHLAPSGGTGWHRRRRRANVEPGRRRDGGRPALRPDAGRSHGRRDGAPQPQGWLARRPPQVRRRRAAGLPRPALEHGHVMRPAAALRRSDGARARRAHRAGTPDEPGLR